LGRRSFREERRRNWLLAEFIRKGIEQAREAEGEAGAGGGTAGSEIDALREMLIADLRRRPADIATLMRKAEVVARMIADQGRLSPQRKALIRANTMQLFKEIGLPLTPPEGQREGGFE
jgi:hypothetical protein